VNPAQGRDYVALLQSIRRALPSPRYALTSALPVGAYCLRNIDLRAAAVVLDYLNLMGYDFAGPWTDVCGNHAQLFPPEGPTNNPILRTSCSGGVQFLRAAGFPDEKVLLGIPAYARYFPGAQGTGHPFKKIDAGEIEYRELPAEWIANAIVDTKLCAAHIVDAKSKGFVSFDVPATVRMKAEWVKCQHLGGLFYWTGVGDCVGKNSLVKVGFENLHN